MGNKKHDNFISNVRHSLIGDIRQALVSILNNQPYALPKISIANWLMAESKKTGISDALKVYKQLLNSKDSTDYYFNESEFNSLGYYLLRADKMPEAIAFFTLNAAQNPQSANAFDSLGEAYMKAGDKKRAIENYKKVLELSPNNGNAIQMLKKLEE